MTRFKEFLDSVLSVEFDHFVTLRYFGPDQRFRYASTVELLRERLKVLKSIERQFARYRTFGQGMDRVEEWLAQIKKVYGEDRFRYLKIMENRRSHQDFLFHVLVGGCEWDEAAFKEHWGPLWRDISGGTSFEREIDERTRGLIWHLVFKADCLLETNDGKKYRKFDFEEE
jgi:hypothetical protein